MAININPVHIPTQFIDLISVEDDAINWEESLEGVNQVEVEGELLEGEDAKKHVYKKEYDTSKLAFKSTSTPTVFRFKNPKVLANREKLDSARTGAFISLNPKQKKAAPGALNRCIWNASFVSYREGLDGEAVYTVKNDTVGAEYLQAFSDAGVLAEFGAVISSLIDGKKKG